MSVRQPASFLARLQHQGRAIAAKRHWESNDLWVGFRIVSPAQEPSDAEKQKFWDDPDPVTKETIQGQNRDMHEIVLEVKENAGKLRRIYPLFRTLINND